MKKFGIFFVVSMTLFLTTVQALAQTVDREITVSSGYGDSTASNGSFTYTGNTAVLGRGNNLPVDHFMLFENIPIAQGTTINSAQLELTLTIPGGNTVNVEIDAYDSVTPQAPTNYTEFSTYAQNLLGSPVQWNDVPTGSWGDTLTSPDLTALIQDRVNDPSWTYNSSILLWIGDNGSSSYSSRQFVTSEFSGSEAKPTLVINHDEVNLPPVTVNDSYEVNGQTTLAIVANDSDPEGLSVTLSAVGNPSHGTTSISGNSVVYTPTSGYVGNDSFSYTIQDPAGNTATGTVSLTVLENPYYYEISFDIDNSAVPDIYWDEPTYQVTIGTAVVVDVLVDDQSTDYSYDAATGNVYISQKGSTAKVIFKNPQDTNVFAVQNAALKDGKQFAWSHSMDDNVYLQNQIDLLNAKGWKGSVNIIGEIVNDTRDEDWITDKINIHTLLSQGWGVGNHGWDSHCSPPNNDWESDVLDGYNRLHAMIADSPVPEYKLIGFAAPCFRTEYDPIIESHRANGTTEVQFNQSQGYGLMLVDGESNYSSGNKTAGAMDSNSVKIGRDLGIETSAQTAIDSIDWMATNGTPTRHFWYNTLAHGQKENVLSPVIDHAYTNYGPDGTDEIWVVSPEEIYSYLLVRDNTVLSNTTTTQLSDGTDPTQSNITVTNTNTSIDFAWNTSRDSSTKVKYGVSSSHLVDSNELNTSPKVQSHSLSLSDLSPCTKYYYQLINADNYEAVAESSIASLTTGGCSQNTTLEDLSETTVSSNDTSEKELTVGDKIVKIMLGTGNVASDTVLQVKKLTNTNNLSAGSGSEQILLTNVYEINAFTGVTPKTTFSENVTVTLVYTDEEIAGLSEESLVIKRYDEDSSNWVTLDNCSVSTSTNTITCTTKHFSLFSIFGTTVHETQSENTTNQHSSTSSSYQKISNASCSELPLLSLPFIFSYTTHQNAVTLFFAPVADAVSKYIVTYGTDGAHPEHATSFFTGNDSAQSITINDLLPNTNYFFTLQAMKNCVGSRVAEPFKVSTVQSMKNSIQPKIAKEIQTKTHVDITEDSPQKDLEQNKKKDQTQTKSEDEEQIVRNNSVRSMLSKWFKNIQELFNSFFN